MQTKERLFHLSIFLERLIMAFLILFNFKDLNSFIKAIKVNDSQIDQNKVCKDQNFWTDLCNAVKNQYSNLTVLTSKDWYLPTFLYWAVLDIGASSCTPTFETFPWCGWKISGLEPESNPESLLTQAGEPIRLLGIIIILIISIRKTDNKWWLDQ